MKKVLKFSALAFTMTALLFSCANPNNSSTTPDIPTVESVNPSDVTKPDGFEPSADATAVTNAETGYAPFMAVFQEVNSINSVLTTNIPEADITKGETEKDPWTVTPKEYKLINNSGTLDIRKFSFIGNIFVEQDYSIYITNFAKFAEKSTDNSTVKSLKSNSKAIAIIEGAEPKFNGTKSVVALFDNGTKNGILAYDLTSFENKISFTKVEFHDLDGAESYKYTAEDLNTLNAEVNNMLSAK